MPWHEWMYYVAFLVGFIYAVVTFILGNVAGGFEGHDGGVGDAGGAVDGGHEVHFSPFSPVVIAIFLASFGGTGILCIKLFEITNILKHLPISLAAGLGVGGLTFYFFFKVFATVQGSVLATDQDIVGTEAEILTSIPGHEQLGEVAYVAKGVRMTAPARSEDGTVIPAHTTVVISKIVGATMYVRAVRK